MSDKRQRAYFDRSRDRPSDSFLGKISRWRKDLSDPSVDHGFVDWLIYTIFGLVAAIYALWNAYFGSRISKTESEIKEVRNAVEGNQIDVHKVEVAISQRFLQHEKEERDRDEQHARDVAREFTDLRKEINTGNEAIMKQMNILAREIKRGNGRGGT